MASPGPVATPSPIPTSGTPQIDQFLGWLDSAWFAILVLAIVLFAVWRFVRPFVHRAVVSILSAQERAMPTGSPAEEIAKRAATLEDLFDRLIRILVLLAVLIMFLGVFDLWPAVAGLGLVLAALTLAGQSVILDYIMGVLILLEGQYYLGDTDRRGCYRRHRRGSRASPHRAP